MQTRAMKTLTRSAIAAGTVLAMSATATAGTINYDFRTDLQNLSYSSDAVPTSTRFFLKTGRIDFKGTLNESLTYEARLAFNKPAAATATAAGANNQNRDALNNSVELAFITHKMSDMFALNIGKFNTEIGGFEGATSGADLYLVSPMYAHTAAGATSAGALAGGNVGINATNPNLLYMTGVKATFALAETQTLSLIATNNITESTDAAGNFNQNRGLLGAVYKGAFFDKTIVGLLSYHEVSPQGTTPTIAHDKHSFISAGLKYDAQPVAAFLEYQTAKFDNDAQSKSDNLNVVIGRLAYNIDEWTPRLEAFTAEEVRGVTKEETNRFTGVGAVLEYKPTADNFRYHVAYNVITAQPATGSEATRTEMVVGARLLGDFLK